MYHYAIDSLKEEIGEIESDLKHQKIYIILLRNPYAIMRAREDITYLENRLSFLNDNLKILEQMNSKEKPVVSFDLHQNNA